MLMILFWSVEVNDIHDKAMKLCDQGVNLEQEDGAAGFLGVTLGCHGTTGLMEMKQVGLIDCVIETLGLDNGMAKGKFTPGESTPFVKDTDGEDSCGSFSYSSGVVMLLYFSGHSRPDISYAINYCAKYKFFQNIHMKHH